MVRFYDPVDSADQQRIEQLLISGGIEYSLRQESQAGLAASQILMAEEDIAEAERLLADLRH